MVLAGVGGGVTGLEMGLIKKLYVVLGGVGGCLELVVKSKVKRVSDLRFLLNYPKHTRAKSKSTRTHSLTST